MSEAYRILERPTSVYPQRAIVSFSSETGAGHAVFRNADAARELLATKQSDRVHEAARVYLEHVGAAVDSWESVFAEVSA